jgi:hypothetical protein
MTRRFLPALLVIALTATSAMLPTVANAQPASRQDRRAALGVPVLASHRAYANSNRYANTNGYASSNGYANSNAYANSNRWGGNRVQAYRQPPQVFRRFSQQSTRQHGAYQRSWHDDRRW